MKNKIKISIFIILAVILCGSILILFGKGSKNFNFSGEYPPVEIITVTENGHEYNIEAVSEHVIVYFKPGTSHSSANKIIENYNGKIIGQKIEICYYLVNTGAGNENNFIQKLKNHPNIDYIFLDTIEFPCLNDIKKYVIDNFNADIYIADDDSYMYAKHGDIVKYAFEECGEKKADTKDAGIVGDNRGLLSASMIDNYLFDILKDTPKDTPVVINMSFGPGFIDENIKLWTDENITQAVKDNYREAYKRSIRRLIGQAIFFTNKDFLIVKSSGNEGIKELDKEVLKSLEDELNDYQKKILYKHFILVGAEDSRDAKYSNTVTSGVYNQLYTSVDISDFEYDGYKTITGTSFAAPRAACYIGKAASDNKLNLSDIRNIISEFNKKNPGKSITLDILQNEAKKLADEKKAEKEKKAAELANETNRRERIPGFFTGSNSFTIGANERNTFTLKDGSKIYAHLWSFGVGDLTLEVINYARYPVSVSWNLSADNMSPLSGHSELAASGDSGSQKRWNNFRIVESGKQALFYEARITVTKK